MFGLKMLQKFLKYLRSFFQYGGWKPTHNRQNDDEKLHANCYLVSRALRHGISTPYVTGSSQPARLFIPQLSLAALAGTSSSTLACYWLKPCHCGGTTSARHINLAAG